MLALLALLVATMFSFSITEKSLHFQRSSIAQEIEEMSASVALRAMEIIRERPYESQIFNPTSGLLPIDPSTATLADLQVRLVGTLPTGMRCSVFGVGGDDCADLNDFNEMETATLPFVAGTDTLYFRVDIDVNYVDADMKNTATPSFRKQVTVKVQDYWPQNGRVGFYVPTPIELSRVITLTL